MSRPLATAALLASLTLVGPDVLADAPPPPKEDPTMLKLTALNGVEARLEGDTVYIRGPLPGTAKLAGEQLAFGPATISGREWTTWSAAALTEARLVRSATADRLDLTLRRLTVGGARSAPIPLPAVDAAGARALEARLAAARARLADVEDVDVDTLSDHPERYHGRMIRLTDVLAHQRFESAQIAAGRGRSFWMDADLPEGSYRLTAVGLFESEPGRTYGHFNMWPGRWQVREILSRRPAAASLVDVAEAAVAQAAAEAFARVERPTLGWEVALTPPIPRPWPVAGHPGELCFLLYAWGTSKAGETHVGSVWGQACVPAAAPQRPVKVEITAPALEDLGPAQAFTPEHLYQIVARMAVGLAADGEPLVKAREIAPHYRAWLATRPQLGPALRAADPAFWRAVE